MANISPYYNLDRTRKRIKDGNHREVIGGLWDSIGQLQFDHLVANGLKPTDRFLDVGCGCLRGGVHFVNYLDAGNYFGIDISQDLLDVGYDTEIAGLNLQHKLPRANLHTTGDFDASTFDTQFDVFLALSVFTHLPLNHIKLCLARLAPHARPDARFFGTVFVVEDADWTQPFLHEVGGITTKPDTDPYHYTRSDMDAVCAGTGWTVDTIGPWNHPRDQWMAVFKRS